MSNVFVIDGLLFTTNYIYVGERYTRFPLQPYEYMVLSPDLGSLIFILPVLILIQSLSYYNILENFK
nr:MAG TPA: hypothetical protein [Bacteriophage sp.]